jgi:hypothetical protein
MAAQKFDFSRDGCEGSPCEVGATFYYQLAWEREDPLNPDTFIAVDITGFTAKMQVRKNVGTPVIIELSTTNNRIQLDGPNGFIYLKIDAADTAGLPPGMYRYDLDLRAPDGFVTRFVQGLFEIVGPITV